MAKRVAKRNHIEYNAKITLIILCLHGEPVNKYIDGKDKQYDDTKERMELEKIADKLFG